MHCHSILFSVIPASSDLLIFYFSRWLFWRVLFGTSVAALVCDDLSSWSAEDKLLKLNRRNVSRNHWRLPTKSIRWLWVTASGTGEDLIFGKLTSPSGQKCFLFLTCNFTFGIVLSACVCTLLLEGEQAGNMNQSLVLHAQILLLFVSILCFLQKSLATASCRKQEWL